MSKSKALNHPESNMLLAALAQMDQPTPSAAQDQHILATINQKLVYEHYAQLFEALVKNPESVSTAQLPALVVKAAGIYHLIANDIARDPALTASDVQARQQMLFISMSEQIKSGPDVEQKSTQASSELHANIPMQNQDAGLSS